MDALHFVYLSFRANFAKSTNDAGASTNGIRSGLVLGFFLLGDGAHLIQIAAEHGCVGHVLCGFSQLQ